MPFSANALNIRALIPIMPTIPRPVTVTRLVSLIEEIPFIALPSDGFVFFDINVPVADGLNVFFILIGIFLWYTG